MPREARIVIPGVPHHVILRGNNRRCLFSYDRERVLLLRYLAAALEASHCALHQLTLMENHLHMIVTPPRAESLAVMVKRAAQRYAQVRNAQRGATGKLFEQRFGSIPMRDDAHVMMATLYNDTNAFRAGATVGPDGHAWSTGPLHAGLPGSRIPRELWTPSTWYLRLGATAELRAAAYREHLAGYLQRRVREGDGYEEPDVDRYRKRLLRPNRTSARERFLRFGRKR